MGFDDQAAWRLDPRVAVRPERFGALAYHYGSRRLTFLRSEPLADLVGRLGDYPSADAALSALVAGPSREAYGRALASLASSGFIERLDAPAPAGPAGAAAQPAGRPGVAAQLEPGLDAPICLTWELTYGCNLACIHCLSSSGRRDPAELSREEAMRVVDDLAAMQVFYVNIGGGEPTIRPDFWDLVSYSVGRGVGVKFSTNGTTMTADRAAQLAGADYVDVQVSIDGADAATNDAVRGQGSWAAARRAMDLLAGAGFTGFKISVVVTRHNADRLDELAALADGYQAQLRLTRLRPSGRGADTWSALHPTGEQQVRLYHWLIAHPEVLTGDSFFHLSALGDPLPGLNLCGAGRVVCLIDPVGDVYACPFVLHPEFKAGSVRQPGGLRAVWLSSDLFESLRSPRSAGACASCGSYDACRGGCMAAKFFTGLPLDGPDPECVQGHGEMLLRALPAGSAPHPGRGHSVPVALTSRRRS